MSETWQDTYVWGMGNAPVEIRFEESKGSSTWETIPMLKKSLYFKKIEDHWVLDKNQWEEGCTLPNYWVEFNDGTAVKEFNSKEAAMDFILSWIIPRQDMKSTFNKEGMPGWWD